MHPAPRLSGPLRLSELVKKIETSASSLKKRLRTAKKKIRNITKEHRRIAKAQGLYAVAVTLTYRSSEDYCAKHLSRFLSCLRVKLKRRGHKLLYVWVMERASALHYHLTLWLPHGLHLAHADLLRWWQWGSTWMAACRNVSHWTRYIAKSEGKALLPPQARLFGCGGLDEVGQETVARSMVPKWLAVLLPLDAQPRRRIGGGWVDMKTGEAYASPWIWTPRGAVLRVSS